MVRDRDSYREVSEKKLRDALLRHFYMSSEEGGNKALAKRAKQRGPKALAHGVRDVGPKALAWARLWARPWPGPEPKSAPPWKCITPLALG